MGNNNNSFFNDILFDWNTILIDEDIVDVMLERGMIVDIYPFRIEDSEKNYQVEVFYRKFVEKNISKTSYLNYENKFLSFIKLLWIYNSTDVFYDLIFDKHFKKSLRKYRFKRCNQDSQIINNISKLGELQFLSALALREAGYMFLHLKNWNVLVMINGFSMLVLCKDCKTNEIIRNLSNSCGLFAH